jgi:hypothetical protein
MRKKLKLLVALLPVAGCTTLRAPVVGHGSEVVVREIVRDSVVRLPPDSAIVRAWFACDSLNRVVMARLETQPGATTQPAVVFNDRLLTVTARVDSQEVYLRWKERRETARETGTVIKEVPVEKIVYQKPKWLVWIAMVGAGAIVRIIVSIIQKFRK